MKIGNLEVYGVIYKVINNINGKIYIGQTSMEKGFNDRYQCKGIGAERIYSRHKNLKENGFDYNPKLVRFIWDKVCFKCLSNFSFFNIKMIST